MCLLVEDVEGNVDVAAKFTITEPLNEKTYCSSLILSNVSSTDFPSSSAAV